jgi:hypothetical protein
MRQVWTAADRRELLQTYATEGAVALSTRLGRSLDSVCSEARRYGLKSFHRRLRQSHSRIQANPTVNSRFFDRSTPQAAFVLGFIWACGSVKVKHRKVLRLVCHEHRAENLQNVLGLMSSFHQLQRYGSRIVVEIGNSRLVGTLTDRFGKPPGRRTTGTLPVLDEELVPHFANGHLFATGIEGADCLRWSGRLKVVTWLVESIRKALPVTAPRVTHWGSTMSAAWTDASHVREIQNWLGISKRV